MSESMSVGEGVDTRAAGRTWLSGAGGWLQLLSMLIGFGSLIAGIALIAHTEKSCVSDGYFDQCSSSHSLGGVGAAVLIGGIVQASLLAVVGEIARRVDRAA